MDSRMNSLSRPGCDGFLGTFGPTVTSAWSRDYSRRIHHCVQSYEHPDQLSWVPTTWWERVDPGARTGHNPRAKSEENPAKNLSSILCSLGSPLLAPGREASGHSRLLVSQFAICFLVLDGAL